MPYLGSTGKFDVIPTADSESESLTLVINKLDRALHFFQSKPCKMEHLKEAVKEGNFNAVCDLCKTIALRVDTVVAKRDLELFYCQYMLSLLITGDIEEARFLYIRSSDAIQSYPCFAAAWKIGKAMKEKNYHEAHIFSQTAIFDGCPALLSVVEVLKQNMRSKQLHVISEAYPCISVENLMSLLGLGSVSEAIDVALQYSWTVDADKKFVRDITKIPLTVSNTEVTDTSLRVSGSHLQALGEFVGRLERKNITVDISSSGSGSSSLSRQNSG